MTDAYTRTAKPTGASYTKIAKPTDNTYSRISKPTEFLYTQDLQVITTQDGTSIVLNQTTLADYTNVTKPIS